MPVPHFMVPPSCMELKASSVDTSVQGVFCKEPISINSKFGPFVGEIIVKEEIDKKKKEIDYRYAWHVSDNKTSKILHVVNATVPEKGNWMRYVNSARFFEEQNIMSVQEGTEIFYKALKDIKPGEELLTWFGSSETKSRKRKRNSRLMSASSTEMRASAVQKPSDSDLANNANGKRLRKKKVSEDMLSLDDDDVIFASSGLHHNRIRNNSCALRRSASVQERQRKMEVHRSSSVSEGHLKSHPQKGRPLSCLKKMETPRQPVSKMVNSTSQQTVSTSQQTSVLGVGDIPATLPAAPLSHFEASPSLNGMKRPKNVKTINQIVDFLKLTKEQSNFGQDINTSSSALIGERPKTPVNRPRSKRSSLVGTAEFMEENLATNYQFVFKVTKTHRSVPSNAPKHVKYACDICESMYCKPLSLKRHVLREHVNHKYLSAQDISLLKHTTAMSTARIEADVDPDADDQSNSDNSCDLNSPRVHTEGNQEDAEMKKELVESFADGKVDGEKGENTVNTDDSKGDIIRDMQERNLTSEALEGKKTFCYSGVDNVEDAFRCHLCVQLFPSVEKLKFHLSNDSHRSKGDKQFGCDRCSLRFRYHHNFQRHMELHGNPSGELSIACLICGKQFRNEANMRKHLRFHSGRNFPCKHGCSLVYPNVAQLTKHLRKVHPELKRGQLMLLDMKTKPEGPSATGSVLPSSSDQTQGTPVADGAFFRTEAEAIQVFKASHPSGWTETRGRKPREGVMGVHCTICKKRFSTYGSMCRHRRHVHHVIKKSGTFVNVSHKTDESPSCQVEEDPTIWDEPLEKRARNIEAMVEKMYDDCEREEAMNDRLQKQFEFSPPPSPNTYFQNVVDNVAENISSYVDGGERALKNARRYIKVEDYVPWSQVEEIQNPQINIDWSQYNLPPNFKLPDNLYRPLSPEAPPVQVREDLLSLDVDKSVAYTTRSAVAERQATRRSSAGVLRNPDFVEKEKIPRRASVGSFDCQNKDGEKMTRRASVGSFDNHKCIGPEENRAAVENSCLAFPELEVAKESALSVEKVDSFVDKAQENMLMLKEEAGGKDHNDVFDSPSCVSMHGVKGDRSASALDTEDLISTDVEMKTSEDTKEMIDESGVSSSCVNEKVVCDIEGADFSVAKSGHSDDLTAKADVPSSTPVLSSESTLECNDFTLEACGINKELSGTNDVMDISGCKESLSTSEACLVVDESLTGDKRENGSAEGNVELVVSLACGPEDDKDSSVNGRMDPECVQSPKPNQQHSGTTSQDDTVAAKNGTGESGRFSPSLTRSSAKNARSATIKTKQELRNTKTLKTKKGLSDQELEYLAKGIVMYVRGNKQSCSHASGSETVPTCPPQGHSEEESYFNMLQLSAKDTKTLTSVSCTETCDSEKMADISESDVKTGVETSDTEKTADISEKNGNTEAVNNEAVEKEEHTRKQASDKGDDHSSCSSGAVGAKANQDEVTPEKLLDDSQRKQQVSKVAPEKTLDDSLGKEQQLSGIQSCSSPSLTQSGRNIADSNSRSTTDSNRLDHANSNDDNSDADEELFQLQIKCYQQIKREQEAIDCDAEISCERCRRSIRNRDYDDPSRRTAKDFADMRFGRNREIFTVCSFCRRYFHGVEAVLRHQAKKHPSIQCSYVEVENGYGLEEVIYPVPSSRGLIAESVLVPPDYQNLESYTCTRCKVKIKSYSRLHAHTLNCDPNTPTTPHSRKKRTKPSRHVPEKMPPDKEKMSGRTGPIRNLSFKPRLQGTVIGLRNKLFSSSLSKISRNYKKYSESSEKDVAKTSREQLASRLSSTRAKGQNLKSSISSSKSKLTLSPSKNGRAQRRRNYELLYNPAAHVRRREKTERVDIHQCHGCRLSFRTLPLLERHTKNCSGKDKILSQRPVANKFLDGQGAKKHSCHYCPKQFRYLKGVYNHYKNNFCHVRAERMSGKGLNPEDLAHEEELQASLQQQAWNKMENKDHTDVIQGRAHLHDDGTITHTRRKGGWPKGLKRSNKRRRNGWTCIKRRKADGNGTETSASPSASKSVSSITSTITSSDSATSAAMFQLEANLREPTGIGAKRKRSKKEAATPVEFSSTCSQLNGGGNHQAVEQLENDKPRGKKGSKKPVDDLSQAPIIDRMDVEPPRDGKQVFDLEPPALSPIPSAVDSDIPQDSVPSKKKKKRKAATSTSALHSNETAEEKLSSVTQDTDISNSLSKKKKTGNVSNAPVVSQAGVTSPVNISEGLKAPLYFLEKTTSPNKPGQCQYKLVPLNIPAVLPKVYNQVTLPSASSATPKVDQSDSAVVSILGASTDTGVCEQKCLPPNFLFPPSSNPTSQDRKNEEGKSSSSTAVVEERKSMAEDMSQQEAQKTPSGRKPRQRKKKILNDAPPAKTINDMFKKKKSPVRYPNTLKSIGAYRLETKVSSPSSGMSSNMAALPSGTVNLSAAITSSTRTTSSTVSSLLAGAGVSVLPPGSLLVLPNGPVMLQPPTTSLPSLSTSSLPHNPAVTAALPNSLADSKYFLVEKRTLSNWLASGQLPTATPAVGTVSAGKDTTKEEDPSAVKTSPLNKSSVKSRTSVDSSIMLSSTVKEDQCGKDTIPEVQPSKPAIDIPNFLYDSVKKPESSASCSSLPPSGGEKKVLSEESRCSQDDGNAEVHEKVNNKMTMRSKSRKPKRGPPPSSDHPNGSKVKSMVMMTAPGIHKMVSLDVSSSSVSAVEVEKDDCQPADCKSDISPAAKNDSKSNVKKTRLSSIKQDASTPEASAREEPAENTSDSVVKKSTRAGKRKRNMTVVKADVHSSKKRNITTKKGNQDSNEVETGDQEDDSVDKKRVAVKPSDKKTTSVVLKVPVVGKRGTKRSATKASGSVSDDDLPLSAVAAKIVKDK